MGGAGEPDNPPFGIGSGLDPGPGKTLRDPFGLRGAAFAERCIGVLENAGGVERRLAVTHEIDFHERRAYQT